MTTIQKCRARGGAAKCIDPDCPEKRGAEYRLNAAPDFNAFLAAKQDMPVASPALVEFANLPAQAPVKTKAPAFTNVKSVADFKQVVKAKYPNVTLSLSGDGANGDFVTLGTIIIPKDQRGSGLGTEIMRELIKAADKQQWNLALTPSGDFGSSKARLEVFYRRFGFIANKGRSRDFMTRETMIRYA